MVLKPSEIAPLSAHVIAEILHEAGVPAGVFNLVDGDGPTVGAAIASHPGIDMVSFTGSTRAGILVDKGVGYNDAHPPYIFPIHRHLWNHYQVVILHIYLPRLQDGAAAHFPHLPLQSGASSRLEQLRAANGYIG